MIAYDKFREFESASKSKVHFVICSRLETNFENVPAANFIESKNPNSRTVPGGN